MALFYNLVLTEENSALWYIQLTQTLVHLFPVAVHQRNCVEIPPTEDLKSKLSARVKQLGYALKWRICTMYRGCSEGYIKNVAHTYTNACRLEKNINHI